MSLDNQKMILFWWVSFKGTNLNTVSLLTLFNMDFTPSSPSVHATLPTWFSLLVIGWIMPTKRKARLNGETKQMKVGPSTTLVQTKTGRTTVGRRRLQLYHKTVQLDRKTCEWRGTSKSRALDKASSSKKPVQKKKLRKIVGEKETIIHDSCRPKHYPRHLTVFYDNS